MGSPTGIVFGKRRPSLGTMPEDVLKTGIVSGLKAPTVAEVYERHSTSNHLPSLADQRIELERARTLNSIVARRHKDRAETRKLLAGAALAEGFGGLDARDPEYSVKAAKLFTQYSEGADSPAAKVVAAMKHEEFTTHKKSKEDHRQAVYNSTLTKRIEPLLASEQIPSRLKNQIVNEDGSFNLDALEKAESIHATNVSARGGKAGAAFYADAFKKTGGLTADDLDMVSEIAKTMPGVIAYQNEAGKQVSADAVKGSEKYHFAVGTVGDKDFRVPLNEFQSILQTHKNIRGNGSAAAATTTQADEQLFLDRQTQEASAVANGVPLITAQPEGYTAWLATKAKAPSTVPTVTTTPTAIVAAPTPGPVAATPAVVPSAPVAAPSSLDDEIARLYGAGGNAVVPVVEEEKAQ